MFREDANCWLEKRIAGPPLFRNLARPNEINKEKLMKNSNAKVQDSQYSV